MRIINETKWTQEMYSLKFQQQSNSGHLLFHPTMCDDRPQKCPPLEYNRDKVYGCQTNPREIKYSFLVHFAFNVNTSLMSNDKPKNFDRKIDRRTTNEKMKISKNNFWSTQIFMISQNLLMIFLQPIWNLILSPI